MFNCPSKRSCGKNDKIEGMASWLILGGFIPLAFSLLIPHQNTVSAIPWHYPYLWSILMGGVSLCTKRAGLAWQLIVSLGMFGFITPLALSTLNFSEAEIPTIIWAIAVLVLLFAQYHHDMKKNHETTDMGVAIVTGASTGIGLATAQRLQQAGYRVFGTSRKATGETINGITMLSCEVSEDASVKKLIETVFAQTGRIDLLVNNAGMGLVGAAEESSIEQAKSLFDVNFFGGLRMTNTVLPIMRAQGNGRIINVSSVLGFLPAPYSSLYAATKHALEGYSESLDHELRTLGIRSILVEPAYTRTLIGDNAPKADTPISIYDDIRTKMESLNNEGVQSGDDPSIIADKILQAATEMSPQLRYTAGRQATQLSFVRRFLPVNFVDSSIRKFNKLPAIKSQCCC